jgi:hypothetical protein
MYVYTYTLYIWYAPHHQNDDAEEERHVHACMFFCVRMYRRKYMNDDMDGHPTTTQKYKCTHTYIYTRPMKKAHTPPTVGDFRFGQVVDDGAEAGAREIDPEGEGELLALLVLLLGICVCV